MNIEMSEQDQPSISDLFPESSRLLLTGGGKEFIERIGVEATRRVIHHVMMGENLRQQTEPLTRRRVTQISGAMVALFARGCLEIDNFTNLLSGMAVEQLRTKKNDKAAVWPAQWLIGLTGKSVQNVLRSKSDALENYISDFESAIEESARQCREDMGNLKMILGFAEDSEGRKVELDWKGITRLTTAIGAQTLAIRGSDKSIYGKLFERLILGSFLTILGFERVNPAVNTKDAGVFWLSDSSDLRESDATLLVRRGKLARFDIGFIGVGNSEISKDKLSRYAREVEMAGGKSSSVTFIIVDRLPKTGKTQKAAEAIGAEIIQMSMKCWPRELAQRLGARLGIKHELQNLADSKISDYLEGKLDAMPVQEFLIGVSPADLEQEKEMPEAEEQIAPFEDEE
ncbi:MAG TPA: CfrBI family restriction endonuclease [Pyrinomonadaceae bacterium]